MTHKHLSRPLSLSLLLAAALIAGMAIGAFLQASLLSDTTASTTAEAEVRIAATPRTDGSVKFGLQQQNADGAWGEVEYPTLSVVPAGAQPNRRLLSSTLTVSTQRAVSTLADDYARWGHEIAASGFLTDGPDRGIWCLLRDGADNEPEQANCSGFIEAYGEEKIEIIRYTDRNTLFDQLAARLVGGDRPLAISVGNFDDVLRLLALSSQLGADEHGANLVPTVLTPPVFIDPTTPSGDTYCVIGHGDNTFWALLRSGTRASASHLGVNAELLTGLTAEARAQHIRDCVADGASAIAVTLADTQHVSEAIQEARAQGVPVITYNSGGESAAASGSMLHLGLDDRRAGELVGEKLTSDSVEGAALCLVHEADNVGLTERCAGLDDTYAGEVEVLSVVDGFEPLSERLTASGVGAVVLLNASDVDAVTEILEPNSEAQLVVIGFDTRLAWHAFRGAVSFAIWDHGILQGYLVPAMAALAQNTFVFPDLLLNQAHLVIEPAVVTAEEIRALFSNTGG